MANRSYLYAIGFDRSRGERQAGDKIHGLAEYAYDIPLAYKILVSQNARPVCSINWDYPQPIAIQGDFDAGCQKLFAFLNTLAAADIFEPAELERQIQASKTFLAQQRLPYAILEAGEIYELNLEPGIEAQNQALWETDILQIDQHLAACLETFRRMQREIEAGPPPGWLARLFGRSISTKGQPHPKAEAMRQEMWDLLGINAWSSTLYYDFDPI